MKKKIIPRENHEVYFLKPPDNIKEKQIRTFVTEQLDRLHPAFSSSTVFDYKLFVFNKTRWIMVTVMEEGVIAEYRLLYKGAALFTNTSIAASGKDFVTGGIKTVDDESIGFDPEKNCPVSIPMEAEKDGEHQEFADRLKNIPRGRGVFLKKMPKWFFPLASAAVVLAVSAFLLFYFLSTYKAAPLPVVEIQRTPLKKMEYLPGAIEILAMISTGIVEAEGEILRWQYNEETESLLTMQLKAVDVSKAHEIFSEYEYVFLQDILNVSYIDGDPHITVNAKIAMEDYTVLASTSFPEQSSFIPVIIELNSAFQQKRITIVSETLPAVSNDTYVITYTANDEGLVSSLEIFTALCEKYSMKVSKMDITINDEKQRFTVVNTLSHIVGLIGTPFGNDTAFRAVPLAFGYREPPPLPAARPVYRAPEAPPETIPVPVPEGPKPPAIGTISGGDRRVEFYRDPVDGKLKMREIND